MDKDKNDADRNRNFENFAHKFKLYSDSSAGSFTKTSLRKTWNLGKLLSLTLRTRFGLVTIVELTVFLNVAQIFCFCLYLCLDKNFRRSQEQDSFFHVFQKNTPVKAETNSELKRIS